MENEPSELLRTFKHFEGFRTSQESLHLPITPWSCCRIDFPMQCLHDPLQQAQYAHLWVDEPNVVKDSINTKGCLEGIKRPILAVINFFVLLTSLVFILHILIFIISRILYTASRNAILLHDPDGTAPGWVFGRGDCGYAKGKTLAEIMGVSPKPSGLVVNVASQKKSKKMNFGKIIPKRFRKNKKKDGDCHKMEESSKFLGDTSSDPEGEGTHGTVNDSIFDPLLNSTMLGEAEQTLPRTDNLNESEPHSMEGEMKRLT